MPIDTVEPELNETSVEFVVPDSPLCEEDELDSQVLSVLLVFELEAELPLVLEPLVLLVELELSLECVIVIEDWV